MRFLPSDRLAGVPHLFVGCGAARESALVLSNERGAPAPPELLADTKTEMALALLRRPRWRARAVELEVVSSDRFELDRLLAVWSLLNAEAALAREARLREAARAGAFNHYHEDFAAQLVCLVRGVGEWHATPAGRSLPGLSCAARDAALFEDLLPLVGLMLEDVRRFDDYWFAEYTDVIRSNAMRHSGAVQIEEYPDLDLAILDTPLDLHDLTRLSCSALSRLLTVRSENTYTFEYRAESWVRYQSRRVPPRIDLAQLAQRLNLFERFSGRWRAEPVDRPVSRLYLDNGVGPAPSSLARETIVAEVLDYLRAHAADRGHQWSPYEA